MQKASLNAHADLSSITRCVKFGLNPYLHLYVLYLSREGSGESVQA